jgi:hypothetical protein
MDTGICNNFCFFFECQCHAGFSPAFQNIVTKIFLLHYSMLGIRTQFIAP